MSPAAAAQPIATSAILPLHGRWDRSVGGRIIDTVAVPGTYPPNGSCSLSRTFTLESIDPGSRYFLRTEGVLARARFSLNGHELGTAGPWSRYRFEIPREQLQRENRITAEITDILMPFGPTPGRRFDAGLFRPIGIERRPETLIREWHLRYTISADQTSVAATLEVELDGADKPAVHAVLREVKSGRVVAEVRGRPGTELTLRLDHPRLWSPEVLLPLPAVHHRGRGQRVRAGRVPRAGLCAGVTSTSMASACC